MSTAAGRYHASAYPSLSSPTITAPCTWVTIGTGPRYDSGVSLKTGRESRPAIPPGGLAQWSVGSTGSRCGRYLPFAFLRSLIHLTRTGLPACASIVRDGALCSSRPRSLALLTAPYPQTLVGGIPAGRICCESCFMEIS